MFTWVSRPASSSPDTFWAVRRAGQAAQNKLNFLLDSFSNDVFTAVFFLVVIPQIALVTNLDICEESTYLYQSMTGWSVSVGLKRQ